MGRFHLPHLGNRVDKLDVSDLSGPDTDETLEERRRLVGHFPDQLTHACFTLTLGLPGKKTAQKAGLDSPSMGKDPPDAWTHASALLTTPPAVYSLPACIS